MANSPLNTPFDNPIVPGPSGSFADSGGFDPGVGPGADPLTTPYTNAIYPDTNQMTETPNSLSGLPLQNTRYNVGEQEPTNMPDISTGMIPVAGLGKK